MKLRTELFKMAAFVSVIAVIVTIMAIQTIREDYQNNVAVKFSLFITPDMTYEELKDTLRGKLTDLKSFENSFTRSTRAKYKIEPGHYIFDSISTNKFMSRTISRGWQTPYKLTLAGNIRGIEKLAGKLGEKMMHDSTSFINHFNDPATHKEVGLSKENFASLFIPNTYEVYWTNTPQEFTNRMKREYDKFWNSRRVEKAEALGLTKEEVSVLASIVCEESNYRPELPTIAGVYINRLKRGMKLEADPTVKFALNDPGLKRVLHKHLKVESPYNTYRIIGLPPGPITIPSIAGIDAVLNYEQHNYLYFCASEKLDGTHKFARTLAEHNKNARAYQHAISRLPKD